MTILLKRRGPVTWSRGNGFGPLLAPVVGAFGAFSLFDEVVTESGKDSWLAINY